MRKLLFLCACLLALASPLRAPAAPPALIVVRIYEGATTTIIITRGEGKSEKIELTNGLSDKKLTQASEGYYKLFESLYREGYTLQSTMNTNFSATVVFTTLLFTKVQ